MPFWQFFRQGRDGHALLVRPSRIPHMISKILFALGADEFLELLEGKIRLTPFFQVQSGKITVCSTYVKGDILAVSALYGALRHWGTILAYRTTGPVEDLKIWKGSTKGRSIQPKPKVFSILLTHGFMVHSRVAHLGGNFSCPCLSGFTHFCILLQTSRWTHGL